MAPRANPALTDSVIVSSVVLDGRVEDVTRVPSSASDTTSWVIDLLQQDSTLSYVNQYRLVTDDEDLLIGIKGRRVEITACVLWSDGRDLLLRADAISKLGEPSRPAGQRAEFKRGFEITGDLGLIVPEPIGNVEEGRMVYDLTMTGSGEPGELVAKAYKDTLQRELDEILKTHDPDAPPKARVTGYVKSHRPDRDGKPWRMTLNAQELVRL